ncbi:GvpL/GvpF family gas vesicle protein [Streptacidiphilus anmyonensis]|uniref:GvpL/GvpF family gas vesicle protein n=1 Tax=Streptacidiphilus anmyonensis TaxID=405782 RepID=UPI0005A6984D|nr:GvpL/GvpF family gas vesicle protein [Streptacidiphilus anmyonensis]
MTGPYLAYTYAVALDSEGLRHVVATLPGVAASQVHLVQSTSGGAVVAAVSPVPAAEFDEAALRRHLEELPWLEEVARAHHHVIEEIAARTTVLPLRLATVYLDDDRVRAVLDERQDAFLDRLARLAGRLEWGVKLYVDAAAAPPPPPPADLGPGRAYLRHRRVEQDLRQDGYRAARTAAERIDAAARLHAVDHVRHRVQQGDLASEPGANVTNDAYLVPVEQAEAFRAAVIRSTDGLPGVRVAVTGPWAPYSFAAPEQEEESAP